MEEARLAQLKAQREEAVKEAEGKAVQTRTKPQVQQPPPKTGS